MPGTVGRARRIASTILILTASAAALPPLAAETQDEKTIRTGSGTITARMIEAGVAVIDIYELPAALIPAGYVGLKFFVTADPPAPDTSAVLLAGETSKTELKALARLAFTGAYEGKGRGLYSNGALVLTMEYPYSTSVVETRWSWDGKNAKLIGAKEYDPQKGIADVVRGQLRKGDLAAAIETLEGILYPDSYLDYREIGAALLQLGYKKAMAEFKAGKAERAAELLSDVFTVDQAAGFLDVESKQDYGKSGYGAFLSFEEFIQIYNDYGFFLEQISDPRAVAILSRTVALDPARAVAFLNLADALWKGGKKADAARNYGEYARLMKVKGFEKQIPPRVGERSAG